MRGIIMDLDNTLVGYRSVKPAVEVGEWVAQALKSGIVSQGVVYESSGALRGQVAAIVASAKVVNAKKRPHERDPR